MLAGARQHAGLRRSPPRWARQGSRKPTSLAAGFLPKPQHRCAAGEAPRTSQTPGRASSPPPTRLLPASPATRLRPQRRQPPLSRAPCSPPGTWRLSNSFLPGSGSASPPAVPGAPGPRDVFATFQPVHITIPNFIQTLWKL